MTEYRYCLHAEVDLASAPQLRADLNRALNKNGASLLIDCSRLTFIDSIGVALLLEANAKLEADGRHMLLLNVHGSPLRVFEALGLTDLFDTSARPLRARELSHCGSAGPGGPCRSASCR